MAYGKYGTLVASLGVFALMLTANETFAGGSGARLRAAFNSTRPVQHPFVGKPFRHHRRDNVGAVWPGVADSYYGGPGYGEPLVDATQTKSGDIRYTYTQDVPWDWAHRFPPNVTPSDRPYVSSCPSETVRVPGRDGAEHTVNITRCY